MPNDKRFEGSLLPDVAPAAEEPPPEVALSWEEEVLRRIAPRLAEVQRHAARDTDVLGWEAAGVRRLVQVTGGEL
jgi:hypothetical protein